MQDKGYLVTNIQLPDSASLERTLEATDKVENIALETPGRSPHAQLAGHVDHFERQQLQL